MISVENLKEKKQKSKVSIFVNKMLLLLFSCQVMSNAFAPPWTVIHQVPLCMGFHRQAYWSGLPFPSPGDLPNPGTEPASMVSPALQVDSLPLSHQGSPQQNV